MTEALKEIYKKIPLIMHEIGAIEKTRRNQQQGYQFRGIDDVYLAAQAIFAKHGVFVVPFCENIAREERQTKSGGNLIYTVLTMRYTWYASDGSSFESRVIGEAMDAGDKSCNKAMSVAQKYNVLQILLAPTEEPKDTENETHEVAPKAKPAPVSAPPATAAPPKVEKPNYDFLQTLQAQKKRIGSPAYYAVLGQHGFEHANEIHDRDTQVKVYNDLKAQPVYSAQNTQYDFEEKTNA